MFNMFSKKKNIINYKKRLLNLILEADNAFINKDFEETKQSLTIDNIPFYSIRKPILAKMSYFVKTKLDCLYSKDEPNPLRDSIAQVVEHNFSLIPFVWEFEVALVMLGIITEEEAKYLFGNKEVVKRMVGAVPRHFSYEQLMLDKDPSELRDDEDFLNPWVFKYRTLIGFTLLVLEHVAKDGDKRFNEIFNKIVDPKSSLDRADLLVEYIFGLPNKFNIRPEDINSKYGYFRQSIIDKKDDVSLVERFLHPLVYAQRDLILFGTYHPLDLDVYKVYLPVWSFLTLSYSTTDSYEDRDYDRYNDKLVADIISSTEENIYVIINHDIPSYGNIFNKNFTKIRKRGLLTIDVFRTLTMYNVKSSKDPLHNHVLATLLIPLYNSYIAKKFDIQYDFKNVNGIIALDIVKQMTSDLDNLEHKDTLKIFITSLDQNSFNNTSKYLKSVLGTMVIDTLRDPNTGGYFSDTRYCQHEEAVDKMLGKKYKDLKHAKSLFSNHNNDSGISNLFEDDSSGLNLPYKEPNISNIDKKYINIKGTTPNEVIEGLKRVVKHKDYTGFVILLNGESGVGKSKFADIIAHALKFDILKISASDILDKWVGGSEQNVKELIRSNSAKSVLLLDEVDGMLPNRENTGPQHEKSLTSEWLSQLDNPTGIIILTTNYKKDLDKALARRISLKLDFEPLTTDGVKTILNSKVKQFGLKRDITISKVIPELEGLRLGDIGVVDKLVVYNNIDTLSKYVDKLNNELKERENHTNTEYADGYTGALGFL